MKKRFVSLLVSCLLFPSFVSAGNISIIIHRDNPITEISDGDLVGFFTKQKKLWHSGNKAIVIDQIEGSSSRKIMLDRVLRKSSREMAMHWIERKQITGDVPPQQVTSDRDVISLVKGLPWAIGYVSSDALESNSGIKVVRVIKEE